MLPASEPQNPALLDEAKSLWLELIGLVHDLLQLAALEAQHAGRSLVVMGCCGQSVAGPPRCVACTHRHRSRGMIMSARESSTVAKRSLPARMQQVEHDIEIHRHLISDRAIVLKQDLRQRLVSPAALLTYAGCGLAVGLMLRRPSRVGGATHSVKAAPGGQTSPGRLERLFANAFKIVAMVLRTLASILPAAPAHPPWNPAATSGDLAN